MQQTTGRAALVANNLPGSKTVTGATNATPIVVTAAAHGLHTNDIFTISGVVGDLAANGTFIAGTVTVNTVALLAYSTGSPVAGAGVYSAGGVLQSQGFGPTVPVPNDLTDAMRAGAINVPFEAGLDRTAFLLFDKLSRTLGGIVVGAVSLLGRKVLIRPRVGLTDANHAVDVGEGDRFNLPSTTAAVRTITLTSSGAGTTPNEGETIGFFCVVVGLTNDANGRWFKFIREDASTAAVVYAATGTVLGELDEFWLFFEFTAGAWALAENSGFGRDGGGGGSLSAYYGVRLS